MKVGISRWRLSVLAALTLGVVGVASQAQPQQEISAALRVIVTCQAR